jgi:hypothetical protein
MFCFMRGFIRVQKTLQPEFRLWRAVPWLSALLLGRFAILLHPEVLSNEGKLERKLALRWLWLWLATMVFAAVLVLVDARFLHIGN